MAIYDENYPRLFEALGRIVYTFSRLEAQLSTAIRILGEQGGESGFLEHGYIMTASYSANTKTDVLCSLLKQEMERRGIESGEIKNLQKQLDAARVARNIAMHSTYYPTWVPDDDGDSFELSVIRERVTARASKGLTGESIPNAIEDLAQRQLDVEEALDVLHLLMTKATGDDGWEV